MKHFKTRKEAKDFIKQSNKSTLKLFKKRKGARAWKTKPFLVGSEFEWLNWE